MTAAARDRADPRALSWLHLRVALLAGLGFGCTTGLGMAMFMFNAGDAWIAFAVYATASIVLALAMVPCLAAAESAAVARVWPWLRYTAAGLVAGGIAVAAGMVAFPQLVLGLDPPTVRSLWGTAPPVVMTGVFAALGYMQWSLARRRASALHAVKLERAHIAREALEARLVALQARIEPVFLFDTLSMVRTLYEHDPAQAGKVLEDLITHLRAALPSSEAASSSLMVELSLVRSWLDIAHARSGGRLVFAIPGSEAPPDARMPPMVLLPLVQHAVSVLPEGSGAIVVSAGMEGSRVIVRVIGPLAAFGGRHDAPAVATARERVAALYENAGALRLQRVAYDRSQAVLDVPYEHSDRRPR